MYDCTVWRKIIVARDPKHGHPTRCIDQHRIICIPDAPFIGLELRWEKEDEDDELEDVTDRIEKIEYHQRHSCFVIYVEDIDVSDEAEIDLNYAVNLYAQNGGWSNDMSQFNL